MGSRAPRPIRRFCNAVRAQSDGPWSLAPGHGGGPGWVGDQPVEPSKGGSPLRGCSVCACFKGLLLAPPSGAVSMPGEVVIDRRLRRLALASSFASAPSPRGLGLLRSWRRRSSAWGRSVGRWDGVSIQAGLVPSSWFDVPFFGSASCRSPSRVLAAQRAPEPVDQRRALRGLRDSRAPFERSPGWCASSYRAPELSSRARRHAVVSRHAGCGAETFRVSARCRPAPSKPVVCCRLAPGRSADDPQAVGHGGPRRRGGDDEWPGSLPELATGVVNQALRRTAWI